MNEFDDLESALATELRRRSGEVLPAPGLAGRARRRARVVRRRRAVAAVAVTAVALAVAVPAALSLRGVPQTAPPADPPTGGTTELVLDGLPDGPPPSIGWIQGNAFHPPGGGPIRIPESMVTPMEFDGGSYGSLLRFDDPMPALTSAGPQGAVLASRPGYGPVLSPDGGRVAGYDHERSMLWSSAAELPGIVPDAVEVPGDLRLQPVGFLDGGAVVSNVSTETEPWAGVRLDTFDMDSPAGDPVTPPWDLVRVSAVSQPAGLVVGAAEIRDDGSCAAVYEVDADEPLWSTCDYSFTHFSPDGRHLVGTTDYPDGEGWPFVVVADSRTGEVVHTFTGTYIRDATFEDDDHLLVDVRLVDGDERLAALVRCDFAGTCELAAPTTRVDETTGRVYGFGLQPW